LDHQLSRSSISSLSPIASFKFNYVQGTNIETSLLCLSFTHFPAL
jgi:hypothetical protein